MNQIGIRSTPPAPIPGLQAAETAILSAEQAGMADDASMAPNEAREGLSVARKAVQDEDMARAINKEIQPSIEVLEQEMRGGSGARP